VRTASCTTSRSAWYWKEYWRPAAAAAFRQGLVHDLAEAAALAVRVDGGDGQVAQRAWFWPAAGAARSPRKRFGAQA
jgi:hypothetical protein